MSSEADEQVFDFLDKLLSDGSFVQRVEQRARHAGSATAMREQRHGVWRDWTWKDVRDHCRDIALGLHALGVKRGDRVAMMGDPFIEGLHATVAVQALGAIPFGIYATSPAESVRFLMDDAGAVAFIAEDQEFIDKLGDDLPSALQTVIVARDQGMFSNEYDDVLRWDALRELGREVNQAQPGLWASLVAMSNLDDLAGIYYTSGTTGDPKGVPLTVSNLLHSYIAAFADPSTSIDVPTAKDRCLHDIPLASAAGPIFGIYLPLAFGLTSYVPDKHESSRDAFVACAPTVYLGFPRMWETHASRALVSIETSSWLHRFAFRTAMACRRGGDGSSSIWSRRLFGRALAWLAFWTVLRPMVDSLGFARMRLSISGGAPLSPDLLRLWRLWGVEIRQIYGMTECSGLATLQAGPIPEIGVAGTAVPRMDVRISDEREILLRGPAVFAGYWRRDQESAEVLDSDGWLRTGDIGLIRDDGNLEVIDRKRDVLLTSSGVEVPASSIEHVLKYSPYVRDAVVIGERRPYLTALIEIDFDNVAKWARTNDITYTGFTNLATSDQVSRLMKGEIDRANQTLEERGSVTVADFALLPKELDPEDPTEITATRKVRRRELASKFEDLVEGMYRTAESDLLASLARSKSE